MIKINQLLLILFCLTTLIACSDMNNELAGGIAGGVAGGALGSTIGHGSGKSAAIIGGTIIGSVLGSRVGRSMDEVDRMKLNTALESTPTNQSYSWNNPDKRSSYSVTPTKTVVSDGQPCRNFTTSANINGRYETVHGRACRDQNGSWKMVS